MGIGSDIGIPERHRGPESLARSRRTRPRHLAWRQGLHRQRHPHPDQKNPKPRQSDWEKEFNRQRNSIRVVVERAIAQLKTWRVLHADYRRPINTFTDTISAVIGLYFYTAE
nr:transposase family protein [Actinokineospora auranticolor]